MSTVSMVGCEPATIMGTDNTLNIVTNDRISPTIRVGATSGSTAHVANTYGRTTIIGTMQHAPLGPKPRTAHVHRETRESRVDVVLNLDGSGHGDIAPQERERLPLSFGLVATRR